ncbi:hypothetical protein [Undibacterium luofuense]|uniref:Uncharacterized protein n=1 Tax=Undibacterium luofuense TaxID=2828733 RepID=A0A941DKX5_9BURK|nr:hypothetical protein [Undibacterium luofuense]MBR7781860.1 hypothetical protein [Undibacterium luofuense]
MSRGKFNVPRLAVILVLLILGVVLVNFKDEAKNFVRIFLESNWPAVVIWLLAIVGVGASKFFSKLEKSKSNGFIYQSFGGYADSVFTIATYGFSGSTSLALLKGLYLQLFFGGAFFTGFGDFDLASIFVISSFLLFYSVISTTTQILEVVFQAEAAEVTSI